ncbi:MAG: hypothetical protein ACRDKB_09790, partial [Actinomycetota bacterium]
SPFGRYARVFIDATGLSREKCQENCEGGNRHPCANGVPAAQLASGSCDVALEFCLYILIEIEMDRARDVLEVDIAHSPKVIRADLPAPHMPIEQHP